MILRARTERRRTRASRSGPRSATRTCSRRRSASRSRWWADEARRRARPRCSQHWPPLRPRQAAQRLTTIETPSRNVDPADVRFNGADHPHRLRANVLLPDGYDGRRRFPVLFLLHGAGGQRGGLGSARTRRHRQHRAGPAGDRRHARGRHRLLHELVERGPARRPRLGALLHRRARAAGRAALPGAAGPPQPRDRRAFDGRLRRHLPRLAAARLLRLGVELLRAAPAPAARRWSPRSRRSAPAIRTCSAPRTGSTRPATTRPAWPRNLRATRLYVTVGNGTPEPGVPFDPARVGLAGVAEAELQRAGGGVRGRRPRRGRRHHLRPARRGARLALLAPAPARGDRVEALQAGARGAPLVDLPDRRPARARCGACATASALPPPRSCGSTARGARLRGRGAGTVTVEYAAGCALTAALPFDRALPPPDLRAHRREGQPAAGAAGAHQKAALPGDPRGGRPALPPAGCAHPHRRAHRADGRHGPRKGPVPAAGTRRAAPGPRGLPGAAHRTAGDPRAAAPLGR